MAENIGEALRLFNQIGDMDVNGINMDSTNDVVSHINHRYKDEVCIPYVAITNNIAFLTSKGNKQVITADGVTCNVIECKEIHICELEKKINELYHIDCWAFIKRWYSTKKTMDSMHFIYLKLERI